MRRLMPVVGAVVLSLLLMGGFVIVYIGYSQGQADRRQTELREEQAGREAAARREQDLRWCGLFAILENPGGAPPTTERGRQAQATFRKLVKDFKCRETTKGPVKDPVLSPKPSLVPSSLKECVWPARYLGEGA